MAGPRGDAAVTKQAILAAARELFAAHGVDGVSVRRIAAEAGVNHALVHRYFGAKEDVVAAIMLAEAEALSGMSGPVADEATSLVSLRAAMLHALTERRTSLVLALRAELDGLAPERSLEAAPLRPLRVLQRWLAEHHPEGADPDTRAVTMVIGAALLGLAAAQPLLMEGAGLRDEDPEAALRRCVDVLTGVAAATVGAHAEASGGEGHDEGGGR